MFCDTCQLNDTCMLYEDECNGYLNDDECDEAIESMIEEGRKEYHEAWYQYISEFYD